MEERRSKGTDGIDGKNGRLKHNLINTNPKYKWTKNFIYKAELSD